MGFQSGINQALGAVAGAAFAIKGQKEKEQEKLTTAKSDLDFSIAEHAQAEAKSVESGYELEDAQKDLAGKQEVYDKLLDKKPGGKGNTKKSIAEKRQQALDELTAAQRAENVLNKKHTANRAMEARWANRLDVLRGTIKELGGKE